jgi:magnesium chelatase family protein
MFARINSCATIGLSSELVQIETDINKTDQTAFVIVGLPDAAIQEAKERVKLAIKNSGFKFPRYKTIVNLSPADLRKEGPGYDLAIAISILKSSEQINANLEKNLFIGELGLNGEIKKTNGILPIALYASQNGYNNLFIPYENADEATLIKNIKIFPVKTLAEVISHLQNISLLSPIKNKQNTVVNKKSFEVDMADIQGQEQVKRALEIAAAGAHNVLMSGPPGSGKTLLAKTLPTILPLLTDEEILEVTKIYSVAGLLKKENPIIHTRPFRSPHHTGSGTAIVGGGKIPKPGEISLAHRGILFLDELPEFPRHVLESLRQPLEDGIVSISRVHGTLSFPARFTLIASQNPCPCGYYSDPDKNCTCSSSQIIRYQKKISGPILDRIDIHIEVPRLSFEKIQNKQKNESSEQIRQRVEQTTKTQLNRFKNSSTKYNAEMTPQQITEYCQIDSTSSKLLQSAVSQFHLSARAFHRILKISRTIADLDNCATIQSSHIAEALQYRSQAT